jgi:PAS domain S-box-containing protein
MILIAGESGRILYASPSTARILGQPTEQLAGRPLQELLELQDRAAADQMFAELRQRSGRTARLDWRFRHHDGSARMLEGIATNLLNDPAVAGIVINARDVSDRRQAELALRERDEQLRQAQKMEAMGLLAGGVAHDFNNLLTVINGYADFLINSLDTADPRHNYAQDVREAGDQAAKLTQQLLAFSRKQVLNSAVLNVNDVVRDTDRMLRRVIGEDIQLVCRLDPSIGAVEADRNQLQQVLMNLAVNARDAMPRGGRLTIETSETSTEPVFITVAVTDTGEGMDEITQRRIFDPFFTTKVPGKGTGLGLSTVYGIVSQSGGKITVRSRQGEGTTFFIHLPRTHRAVEKPVFPALPTDMGGHETILVVEDQPDVRSFACRSLQTFGYHVLEASGAEDALRIAARDGDSIDLLLTDVVMPGMNGVELSKQLRAQYPKMKVVYASGYADSVMLRHGVTDTGAAFIPKPYGPAVLAKKIREVLGRESSHAAG